MKIPEKTIPTEFLPLDTRLTDPDEFVNVYTLHTAMANHNVLQAQRVRKNLIGMITPGEEEYPEPTESMEWKSRQPMMWTRGPLFLQEQVFITQGTKQVRFWFRGGKTDMVSAFDDDPKVYALVRNPNATVPDITRYSATINCAVHPALANYTIDINIHPAAIEDNYHYGRQLMVLEVYATSFIDTANAIHAASAITDVGQNWFESSVPGSGHEHDVVFVDTNVDHEPRMITRVDGIGGSAYRYYLDDMWPEVPTIADTVTICEVLGPRINSWGLYELPTTDFEEGLAL